MAILVVGSGRWAKVIATVLAQILPQDQRIRILSTQHSDQLSRWIQQQAFRNRIDIQREMFPMNLEAPTAVIVVNKASSHFAAAKLALDASLPTLVEKPMALTAPEIENLIAIAEKQQTILAASHVFLFSRYLRTFSELVRKCGPITSGELIWEDTSNELRYGDIKTYDSSLTVLEDVLPHVIPLVEEVCGHGLRVTGLNIVKGGSQVDVRLNGRGAAWSIQISRDSGKRVRAIHANAEGGSCKLDFSNEPGTITTPASSFKADVEWETGLRPMASMLTAFLATTSARKLSPGLSPQLALRTATIIDGLRSTYRDRQTEWLCQMIGSPLSQEIRYALKERNLLDSFSEIKWANTNATSLRSLLGK